MMRTVLQGIACLLGIGVLVLAGLFGINATDEPLSAQAQAALQVPPPPPPSENNGFIDFLALRAPADAPTYETGLKQLAAFREQSNGQVRVDLPAFVNDPRLKGCRRGEYLPCVAAAPGNLPLQEWIDSYGVFLKRYREMRAKPEFVDLLAFHSPEDPLPPYVDLTNGQRLSLMSAAVHFNRGDGASAIGELEAEFAFYRKVAAGSGTLFPKMIAVAMLDGAALFAAELARNMSPSDKDLWARLNTLLRAPTKAELDIVAELNQDLAQTVGYMQTRDHVRLSDSIYEVLCNNCVRPWWDPVKPWLYRPHYSVNRYVVRSKIMQAVVDLPSQDFLRGVEEHRARAEALGPVAWEYLVLSPAAINHPYFGLGLDPDYDFSVYIGRMHGHAAVQMLVGFQVRLRAAGITKPMDVLDALDGPLGSTYPNPFTGKPFEFDQVTMTIGFACDRKYLSGVAKDLVTASARVELPL